MIRESDGYSPDGVLAWFPEFNAYGSADTDHGRIILYPGVTWLQIQKEPTWYINGQWYPENVVHVEINPWLTAEIEAYHSQFAEPKQSTLIALAEFAEGLPVDRQCPFCQVLIRVQALGDTEWRTECDCGRCTDTLKGS